MQLSRRLFLTGAAGLVVAGCENADMELGAELDEGGFGNPTMHNALVHSGQIRHTVDLAHRFAAEVPDTVNFAFDSAALDHTARSILDQQAHWIRQFPEVRFRVFGHTDLVGSARYNHQLGLRRARSVVDYLVRQGVGRARLEAVVSRGETQPLIPTHDREYRNRRTVTEVSGFVEDHPRVMDGRYAMIVRREYIGSATQPHGAITSE